MGGGGQGEQQGRGGESGGDGGGGQRLLAELVAPCRVQRLPSQACGTAGVSRTDGESCPCRLLPAAERELRLQFLQRREAWVAGLVAEVEESGSAYELLKRLTDIYRLHLFDVVMQYRAIFSDDPGPTSYAAPLASPRTPRTPPPQAAGAAGAGVGGRGASRDGGILHVWAQRRVAAYLEAVHLHLPRIGEGASLASVLDHTMYCGMSLGRVGMDFRPLLAPLFEARVLELFTQVPRGQGLFVSLDMPAFRGHAEALPVLFDSREFFQAAQHLLYPCLPALTVSPSTPADAGSARLPPAHTHSPLQAVQNSTDTLSVLLETYKWNSAPMLRGRGGGRDLSSPLSTPASAAPPGGQGADGAAPSGPPYALMEYQPLAVYTNGLLAAFNELRHCAPLSVRNPATAALQRSLGGAAAALARQGSIRTLGEAEQAAFDGACRLFTGTLGPYAVSCIQRIYPGAALQLDLRAATQPLAELMAAPAAGL